VELLPNLERELKMKEPTAVAAKSVHVSTSSSNSFDGKRLSHYAIGNYN
jgi:hypothetical protein